MSNTYTNTQKQPDVFIEPSQPSQPSQIIDETLPKRYGLLELPYAAIDLEYNYFKPVRRYMIYAASIVDNNLQGQTKLLADFPGVYPERALVQWLQSEMLKYPLTFGYYSRGYRHYELDEETGLRILKGRDTDLKVLESVCRHFDVPSIVSVSQNGAPYINRQGYRDPEYTHLNVAGSYTHIDLYDIYVKQPIKVACKNRYKNLRLGTVTKAELPDHDTKFKNYNGKLSYKLPSSHLRAYCEQDARLVIKLVQNKDYTILDIMQMVSNISGLLFDNVCRTTISNWMGNLLRRYNAVASPITKKRYKGGHVFDPIVGRYEDSITYLLDVKSLYPTMIIKYNISPETVCCKCCAENAHAYVPGKIMYRINADLPQNEQRPCYWICRQKQGVVPYLLKLLREERFKYDSETAENKALKLLLNGTYGLLGNTFFEFADFRAAELCTSYGRDTLNQMYELATNYGFKVLYGDTDSIFCTNATQEQIDRFIQEWLSVNKDIIIEPEDIVKFRKLLLFKKKHYLGVEDKTNLSIIKGLEGSKSDRAPFINKVQEQFAEDYANDVDPVVNLKRAYMLLEKRQIPLEDLQITMELKRDPTDYKTNIAQKLVGTEIGAVQGETIEYYKSSCKGKATAKAELISYAEYIKMFESVFRPQVEILGRNYDKEILGVMSIAEF
jgi:DNA polymerase elongation subunit (family B)